MSSSTMPCGRQFQTVTLPQTAAAWARHSRSSSWRATVIASPTTSRASMSWPLRSRSLPSAVSRSCRVRAASGSAASSSCSAWRVCTAASPWASRARAACAAPAR